MVMSDEEITRLHRLRKTVMELLRDRGYMVSDFEVDMSRHQFIQKYGEDMKREDLFINKALRSNNSDQDNVFLNVVALIQYRALADKASDAFYKLSNTRSQIQAYVFDMIRSHCSKAEH